MVEMSVMHWWNEHDRVKQKYEEENLSSYQFVRQKSLPWNWTQAFAVNGGRLTALVIAPPLAAGVMDEILGVIPVRITKMLQANPVHQSFRMS
jgi:hypothetical protein